MNTSITSIECQHLTKQFAKVKAVDGISFSISPGEKVMLLGANGAGKSTTMNMLLGLEKPTSGVVKLNQCDPTKILTRIHLGVAPQESDFIDELTVLETIMFVKKHYPNTYTCSEIISIFMLDSFKNKKTAQLSLGQKRRLALALAFLNKPSIVFLDEPTVGLDVESRRNILSFIHEYTNQPGVTLFLTTHYLEEAEMLTNRVLYLQNGRIKFDGHQDKFKSQLVQSRIEFNCEDAQNIQKICEKNLMTRVEQQNNRVTIYSNDSDSVIRSLVQTNIQFNQLQIQKPSLEDAFLSWQEE